MSSEDNGARQKDTGSDVDPLQEPCPPPVRQEHAKLRELTVVFWTSLERYERTQCLFKRH